MKISDEDIIALEALVAELEAGSAVEVVVAIAPQSGSYADLELAVPIGLSWTTMAALVFSPFVFPDWGLFPGVIAAFLVGLALTRMPALRGLVPRERARQQVAVAARAAFVSEHVSATEERTGVLVYLSQREGEVAILPDYGVQRSLPDAHWNEAVEQVRQAAPQQRCAKLLESLRPLAPLLAQKLPRANDDRDELSNAPRRLA